ncbi:FAD/NAD(P)-binding domain-containing protein [Xylariaceae sp. FL0804]|nr:FAD/NAD(P)-binding domain-containing protein [Xylariaceae sp. FL0804]
MSSPPPRGTIPHVLISGAGLGGLALAQGLKKHLRGLVDFTVLERDPGPDVRAQGYRIKVFPDAVPDLRHLLATPELFARFEAAAAETVMVETTVGAVDGRPLARRALRGPRPYTVDRGALRRLLLTGLEGHVRWGKEVTRYEVNNTDDDEDPDRPPVGTVTAFCADGSAFAGTLLVGADGAGSRVRRQHVPHHRLVDPEAVCVYGRTPLTPELERRVQPRLLRGLAIVRDVAPVIQQVIFASELPVTMFVERMHFPGRDSSSSSSGRESSPSLPAHDDDDQHQPPLPLPDDYMYWAMLAPSRLLGPTEPAVAAAFAAAAPRDLAATLTEEWDDATRCLVELQDAAHATSLRVVSSTPDLCDWPASPHVTLLGDAVHVMSPAGGVGAATALGDAAALTRALTSALAPGGPGGGVTASTVREYEAVMRSAAKVAIERSFRGGELFYGQPPLEKCRVLANE